MVQAYETLHHRGPATSVVAMVATVMGWRGREVLGRRRATVMVGLRSIVHLRMVVMVGRVGRVVIVIPRAVVVRRWWGRVRVVVWRGREEW